MKTRFSISSLLAKNSRVKMHPVLHESIIERFDTEKREKTGDSFEVELRRAQRGLKKAERHGEGEALDRSTS